MKLHFWDLGGISPAGLQALFVGVGPQQLAPGARQDNGRTFLAVGSSFSALRGESGRGWSWPSPPPLALRAQPGSLFSETGTPVGVAGVLVAPA